MSTMQWKIVQDTIVVVHDTMQPKEEDWAAYLDGCRQPGVCKHLVFADTTLSANQRRGLLKTFKATNARAAVVCSSALTRGVVTALGWMSGISRAFSPNDLTKALDFLNLEDRLRKEALEAALGFASEFGLSELQNNLERKIRSDAA